MLLLANLLLSAFLTGLIWFVQMVHYPIFRKVPASHYLAYHAAHTQTTGQVVAVPMLVELAIGFWLVTQPVPPRYRIMSYAAFGCVLLIWAVTFLVSIPLHNKLVAQGFNLEFINRLVSTNWLRTFAWTLRTGLLTYLAYYLLLK